MDLGSVTASMFAGSFFIGMHPGDFGSSTCGAEQIRRGIHTLQVIPSGHPPTILPRLWCLGFRIEFSANQQIELVHGQAQFRERMRRLFVGHA